MKLKAVSGIMLTLFLASMLTVSFNITTVRANETTIFEDDFESYDVGTFPSGWTLFYTGKGVVYQRIVNTTSVSPTKSFQLWGMLDTSAAAKKTFSTEARIIGYEVYVRIEEMVTDHAAYPGFFDEGTPLPLYPGDVLFAANGEIHAMGTLIGTWVPDNWYKVRVELDTQADIYDVWIDDELKGENIATHDTQIVAFQLQSEHAGVPVYFDDVKVFEVATPVGGISIPVNKLELLAPYIGLTVLLAVAVVTIVYVEKRKRNTEINS